MSELTDILTLITADLNEAKMGLITLSNSMASRIQVLTARVAELEAQLATANTAIATLSARVAELEALLAAAGLTAEERATLSAVTLTADEIRMDINDLILAVSGSGEPPPPPLPPPPPTG